MSGYGQFQISTLGMRSQANRLNTISTNIANVNTGGYRRTDTEFETLLSKNFFQQSDVGGVKPVQRHRYDLQGLVTTSDRALDLAISGQGFFAVQPQFNSSTQIFYTRDGAFQISTVDGQTSTVTADDNSTITVSNGYLVDKNGYFVLGSPMETDGTFSTSTAAPMRVDQYAFTSAGVPTTQATLEFNLPSNDNFGDTARSFTLTTYDSNSAARNITFNFARTTTDNTWRVTTSADNLTTSTLTPGSTFSLTTGTTNQLEFNAGAQTIKAIDITSGVPKLGTFSGLRAGDTITLGGTASNNGTHTIASVSSDGSTITVTGGTVVAQVNTGATPASVTSAATITDTLVFDQNGQIQSPTTLTFNATWSDAATSTFNIDIGDMKQFAGAFTPFTTSQNGLGIAEITDIQFDGAGYVVGSFSDGTQRNIYKIPLYTFTNINGLHAENGQVFEATQASGEARAFFADESSMADFVAFAHEISNVDISTEFTRMIQTQTAYNMNATAFRTMDEMTVVARDLKT